MGSGEGPDQEIEFGNGKGGKDNQATSDGVANEEQYAHPPGYFSLLGQSGLHQDDDWND